jgi:lantibiotic modifying enzyme
LIDLEAFFHPPIGENDPERFTTPASRAFALSVLQIALRWLTGIPYAIETPGLLTGLSGIGYALLRLAEPEKVPSVLLPAPPLKR